MSKTVMAFYLKLLGIIHCHKWFKWNRFLLKCINNNSTQKTSKKYFQYHSKPPLWYFRYSMKNLFDLNHNFIYINNISKIQLCAISLSWNILVGAKSFLHLCKVFAGCNGSRESLFLYIFKTRHISQNSHWIYSVRKDVHRNFAKFKGKHLYQNLFFHKFAGWGLQLYQKDFGTSVSLWILQNF